MDESKQFPEESFLKKSKIISQAFANSLSEGVITSPFRRNTAIILNQSILFYLYYRRWGRTLLNADINLTTKDVHQFLRGLSNHYRNDVPLGEQILVTLKANGPENDWLIELEKLDQATLYAASHLLYEETKSHQFLDYQCGVCGCIEEDCSNCIEKTGHACSWINASLCSACAPSIGRL